MANSNNLEKAKSISAGNLNSGLSCLIITVTYEYIFRTILLKKIVASSFGFAVDFIPTQSPLGVLAHIQKSLNHQRKNVFSTRKYLPLFLNK